MLRLGFAVRAPAPSLSLATILFYALLERASLGFKPLRPKLVSIYDPYFWSHERHWKLSDSPIMTLFKGTPFKNVISRLLGVKIGRKVYDDGCSITERTLIEIGDYCQPQRGLPSCRRIRSRKACSSPTTSGSAAAARSGAAAFVHYGVTMGDHVGARRRLLPDEGRGPGAAHQWRGNPAKTVRGIATKREMPAAVVVETALAA